MPANDLHIEVKGYSKQFLIEGRNHPLGIGGIIRQFSKYGNEIRAYIVNNQTTNKIKTIDLLYIFKKSGKRWYLYDVDDMNLRNVYDDRGGWIEDQRKANGKWVKW